MHGVVRDEESKGEALNGRARDAIASAITRPSGSQIFPVPDVLEINSQGGDARVSRGRCSSWKRYKSAYTLRSPRVPSRLRFRGKKLGRTIHMRQESAYIAFFHDRVHETVARRAVTETSGRTAYARITPAHRRSGKIKSRPRRGRPANRGINAGLTMRGKPEQRVGRGRA